MSQQLFSAPMCFSYYTHTLQLCFVSLLAIHSFTPLRFFSSLCCAAFRSYWFFASLHLHHFNWFHSAYFSTCSFPFFIIFPPSNVALAPFTFAFSCSPRVQFPHFLVVPVSSIFFLTHHISSPSGLFFLCYCCFCSLFSIYGNSLFPFPTAHIASHFVQILLLAWVRAVW